MAGGVACRDLGSRRDEIRAIALLVRPSRVARSMRSLRAAEARRSPESRISTASRWRAVSRRSSAPSSGAWDPGCVVRRSSSVGSTGCGRMRAQDLSSSATTWRRVPTAHAMTRSVVWGRVPRRWARNMRTITSWVRSSGSMRPGGTARRRRMAWAFRRNRRSCRTENSGWLFTLIPTTSPGDDPVPHGFSVSALQRARLTCVRTPPPGMPDVGVEAPVRDRAGASDGPVAREPRHVGEM